ncbi:MAG TPA: rhodanese-like domain-containing protein [Chloroflexia bacterium]|nr:rhodanese-like domain-containing protein [Chloroflexia bacterium]
MWNNFSGRGQAGFKEITPAEAKKMYDTGEAVLIDVREPVEFSEVRAEGAKLIPLGSLEQRLHELPSDKDILMICRSGGRSAMACQIAARAGHSRLYNVSGGTIAWYQSRLPVETGQ